MTDSLRKRFQSIEEWAKPIILHALSRWYKFYSHEEKKNVASKSSSAPSSQQGLGWSCCTYYSPDNSTIKLKNCGISCVRVGIPSYLYEPPAEILSYHNTHHQLSRSPLMYTVSLHNTRHSGHRSKILDIFLWRISELQNDSNVCARITVANEFRL